VVACLALVLAACGDKDRPTDEALMKALQAHYDANPLCVGLPSGSPVEVVAADHDSRRRRMDALVKVGLFTAETVQKPGPAMFEPRGTITYIRYMTTPAGERAILPAGTRSGGDGPQLCFAKRSVQKVQSFTEPADAMGVKATHVTYSYGLKEIAVWTTDAAVQDAFPPIKEAQATAGDTATDTLILTNHGWRHERDAQ
jgi:hypothetical protein